MKKAEYTLFRPLLCCAVLSVLLTGSQVMASPQFSAQISTGSKFAPNQDIPLDFTLTNNNEEDYHVLVWKTPLEGFYGNCLDVQRDGEPVKYKGIMVKRGNPMAEEYILIPAGGSAKETVTLNEGYDVSTPGHYSVAVRTTLMDVKRNIDGVEFQPAKLSEGKTRVELSSDPITFDVED